MLAPALAPDLETEAHRRRHLRRRVLRRAVVVEDGGGDSLSCLILDVSQGGARVQMLDGQLPKGGMTLVDARTGALHRATTVWRDGPFAGVRFESTVTLQPPSSEAEQARSRLRVLAVDDDATNRFVLEKVLNRLEAEIVFAVDGLEAVTAFESQPFDIVLMDLRMPGMSGYEAIRRIRSFELGRGSARTPIVVISAHTDPADLQESGAAGADEHLCKPVRTDALLEAIRRQADIVARANA